MTQQQQQHHFFEIIDFNEAKWIIDCSAVVEISVQYPSSALKISEKHPNFAPLEVYSITFKDIQDMTENLQNIMIKIKEFHDNVNDNLHAN
jgi:hypothetical protein